MPSDRKLDVGVYFVAQEGADGQFGGVATYLQTNSVPETPQIVALNGDVDLNRQPPLPGYTGSIDITFTLHPTVLDKHGNPLDCRWATPIEKAIAVSGPDAAQMVSSYASDDGRTILLDDQDTDSNTYTYKLGVTMPERPGSFVSLDPQITNRGGTSQ